MKAFLFYLSTCVALGFSALCFAWGGPWLMAGVTTAGFVTFYLCWRHHK